MPRWRSDEGYKSTDTVGDIENAIALLRAPEGHKFSQICIDVADNAIELNWERRGNVRTPISAAHLLAHIPLEKTVKPEDKVYMTAVTNKFASAIDVAIQQDRKAVTWMDFLALYLAMAYAPPLVGKILARRRGLAHMERFSEVVKNCGPRDMRPKHAAFLFFILATLKSRGHMEPSSRDIFNVCIKIEDGCSELTSPELATVAHSARYLPSAKYSRTGRMLRAVADESLRRGDVVEAEKENDVASDGFVVTQAAILKTAVESAEMSGGREAAEDLRSYIIAREEEIVLAQSTRLISDGLL